MVDRVEDLNLPNSTVSRLIKEILPENTNVSKETKAAIARAASVFVIFLTSSSTALAAKENHKSISPSNVFNSLKELDFEHFIEPLEKELAAYRQMVKEKKESKAKKDEAANNSKKASTADDMDIPEDEVITGE